MNWDISTNLIIELPEKQAKVRALRILWAVPPRTTTRSIGSNSFGCTAGFLHAGGPVTARGFPGFCQLTVGLIGAKKHKHNTTNPKHIKKNKRNNPNHTKTKMKKQYQSKPHQKFFVFSGKKIINLFNKPTSVVLLATLQWSCHPGHQDHLVKVLIPDQKWPMALQDPPHAPWNPGESRIFKNTCVIVYMYIVCFKP